MKIQISKKRFNEILQEEIDMFLKDRMIIGSTLLESDDYSNLKKVRMVFEELLNEFLPVTINDETKTLREHSKALSYKFIEYLFENNISDKINQDVLKEYK